MGNCILCSKRSQTGPNGSMKSTKGHKSACIISTADQISNVNVIQNVEEAISPDSAVVTAHHSSQPLETSPNTAADISAGLLSNLSSSQSSCHSNSAFYFNNLLNTNDLSEYMPPTGKNKRLKKDFFRYIKLDRKISDKQLQSKRDEFWDTAPAFEGKPEIWTALHAAVDACEAQNFKLAQAIIDSANIILPNGLLNDCYDEFGCRYQLPIYVLVRPVRPNTDGHSSNSKWYEKDSISIDDSLIITFGSMPKSSSSAKKSTESKKQTTKKKPKKKKWLCKSSKNAELDDAQNPTAKTTTSEQDAGTSHAQSPTAKPSSSSSLIDIKLRLSSYSNQNDAKLTVNPCQRVSDLKQQIKEIYNVEPSEQKNLFWWQTILR